MSEDWSLYILRCGDGTLYTGIAVDVQARLEQHCNGKGAKYTRGRWSWCTPSIAAPIPQH